MVRPLHRAAGAGARAAVGHRAGDRLAPRDRGQPAAQLRSCRSRSRRSSRRAVLAGRRGPSADRRWHVRARRVRDRGVGQEFWRGVRARRAMSGEPVPARAGRRSCAATAAATAATSCTSGMAVLFIGVAASSAFQHARDVRLGPGQTRARRRLRASPTCARPAAVAARTGGSSRSTSARELRRVARTASTSPTLQPTARLLPVAGSRRSGRSARFFEGEATSEVGLRAGLAARRLDGDRSPTSTAAPADRRGRQGVPRRRSALAARRARSRWPPRSRGAARALHRRAAAGDVPADRVAAGHVDLDRRR